MGGRAAHEPPPTQSLEKAHDIGAVFAKALSSHSPFAALHDAFSMEHLFTAKKGINAVKSVGRAASGGDLIAGVALHPIKPAPIERSEHWLEAHGMA